MLRDEFQVHRTTRQEPLSHPKQKSLYRNVNFVYFHCPEDRLSPSAFTEASGELTTLY